LDTCFIHYLKNQFFPSFFNKNFKNKEYLNTSSFVFNKDSIINSIDNDLQQKLPHFFLKWLKDNNCILSGSFILKHIINADWISNDLDFYCLHSMQSLRDITRLLNNNNIMFSSKSSNMSTYHMDDIKNMISFELSNDDSDFVNFLINNGSAANFKSNSIKIQIMFIDNYQSPWDFIQKNFDFDIVMNAFVFNNNNIKPELLTSHNDLNNFHLATISDSYINTMNHKGIRSYSNYRAAKTTERAIKYMKRGFVISNIDQFLHHVLDTFF
jgi:hypothetical protein